MIYFARQALLWRLKKYSLKSIFKPFILLFAFVNLIVGMISGLGRMGWRIPLPEAFAHHGAIMVGGFLGSLIALEKVIPLKKFGLFIGPLLSATSVIVIIAGNFQYAVIMIIAASLLLQIVYGYYLEKQYSLYLLLALIGAMCWFFGNLLLLWKQFYAMVLPWWMGFLLFTIVSERMELSKFLPVTRRSRISLVSFLGLFLLGIILPFHGIGIYIAGLSLVLISIWLMRHDVVRLIVKLNGLAKFTGIALLCGYVALLLEGIFLITLRDVAFGYDVIVHTFFLGFIFSMIFAHGPIILPGVLGLTVKPYHPLFYFPLVILYGSLFIRILADAMVLASDFQKISGWFSAGGILFYFTLLLISTVRALRHAKSS